MSRVFRTAWFVLMGACTFLMARPAAALEPVDPLPDLEERIAHLEETAARLRNKPLSVSIGGLVHRALLFWDDGHERNVYAVTNDNAPSRFTLSTKRAFGDGWNAGFYFDIGVFSSGTFFINQTSDNYEELRVRYSFAYLDNDKLGRISIGQTGGSSADLAGVNFSVTNEVFSFYGLTNVSASMYVRTADGRLSGLTWARLIRDRGAAPGEAGRGNIVRYDTPTLSGFRASVSWGEDDFWDAGLRYTGKIGDVKLDVFLIYGENTENADGSAIACLTAADQSRMAQHDALCRQAVGITSVMHEPTGLYANFAAGWFNDDLVRQSVAFSNVDAKSSSNFWAMELGVAHKWFELGTTTIFGQHYEFRGGANARRFVEASDAANPFGIASRIYDTGAKSWSGGIVQTLAKANTDVFLIYRRSTPSLHVKEGMSGEGALAAPSLEPLQYFLTGAIIRF